MEPCSGRDVLKEMILLVSKRNTCPAGLDIECVNCIYYENNINR